MKTSITLIFGLLLTFCSVSCITEEQYDDSPQGNFEALWKIIDERYCFFEYKADAYGLDWDEVKARYSSRFDDSMSGDQLFEVLAEVLAELRDGHVNLFSSGDIARYWSWYEDHPANYSEYIQNLYLGTDYRIASGLKYKIFADNVGYVYCASFNSGIGEGNLDAMFHYLAGCNGLILDLRNNSGGLLTTSDRLAQRFTNEKIHTGYIQHKTGPGHGAFSTPTPTYLESSNGIRWQKGVVVLTNRKCYSATNDFIRNVKGLPLVTLLGDRSGGGSGLPFSSELPNGWSLRFSACPSYDKEMQHIEFGIDPDIWVSFTPEDFLRGEDTLIEAARRLFSGED